MAGQLEAYHAQVLNFLRTCTIKFTPFAWTMGRTYMDTYGLDDPHQPWNPYYINMSGAYAPDDEYMTVYSVEEGAQIPFSKETLATHPKTASLYKVGTTEYTILEEKYPLQRGLIRTIAYPTPSIEDIIAAPNLSLLGYDPSFLDINEQESLVLSLKNFLDFCNIRWWIEEYTYEDMFAATFWGMIWQIMPVVMLTQRFKNIQTPYVHEFHVWEYLQSHGLQDYRDVLSNKQSLWLYRNIKYIEKNKGKQSNLKILAENLLEDVSASLIYKDLVQETATNFEPDLKPTPEFRSYDYVTDKEVKDEDFPTLNKRLVEIDIEHNDSEDYIKEKEEELGVQPHNELPTKFLEIRKDPIDQRDEDTLTNFLWDTLIYRLSKHDLNYEETVIDPLTSTELKLPLPDVFNLFSLCVWRALGCPDDPVYLPNKIPIHMAFQRARPSRKDIREHVFYSEIAYRIDQYVDVQEIINMTTWWDAPFTKGVDFMTVAIAQWKVIKSLKQDIENSNDYLFHSSLVSVLHDILRHEFVEVNPPKSKYADWLYQYPEIQHLLDILDTEEKPHEAYARVARKCYDVLFPLDRVEGFKESVRILDKIYTSIRDLFIRLCSYNVVYLEMERDSLTYRVIEEPDLVWPLDTGYLFDGVWSWINPDLIFSQKLKQYIGVRSIDVILPVTNLQYKDGWLKTLLVDYYTEKELHQSSTHQLPIVPVMYEAYNQQHTQHQLKMHETSISPVVTDKE